MNCFKYFLPTLFFFICGVYSVHAQTTEQPVTEQPGWFKKSLDSAMDTTNNLYHHGRTSVILSGYAYHGRGTYTPEKIASFNEKAWGLGISKELRDEKDNEQSINLLLISDSHKKPQTTLGYSYQWMRPLVGNWEVGIGYTALLISRLDIINGIPFPAILPLATIGTRDTKLAITYIPRLSGNKGNGDVLYLALRVGL